MDNDGVLVIITSSLCGGCKAFKPSLPDIEKYAKSKGIKYVYQEEKHSSGNEMYSASKALPSLGNINWYPFIFYTDNRTYESLLKGSDKRDKIKVLNGKFVGNGYALQSNMLPNANTVSNWIDKMINGPVVLNNNEWTKESMPEASDYRSSRTENSSKMNIIPRRKYGRKRKQ